MGTTAGAFRRALPEKGFALVKRGAAPSGLGVQAICRAVVRRDGTRGPRPRAVPRGRWIAVAVAGLTVCDGRWVISR